jgi:hypothetical protein
MELQVDWVMVAAQERNRRRDYDSPRQSIQLRKGKAMRVELDNSLLTCWLMNAKTPHDIPCGVQ